MLGCLPFWFRSVSAFDLSFVTTFISGSNILAIPSNPSSHPPWRWQSRHYLAVLPSEESSRATLSWELHTTKLLWSHVPIGYQWQSTEFCPNSIGQNGHPRDFVSHASLKFRVLALGNAMTVFQIPKPARRRRRSDSKRPTILTCALSTISQDRCHESTCIARPNAPLGSSRPLRSRDKVDRRWPSPL